MTPGTVTLLPSPLRPVGVASVQGTLALDLTPGRTRLTSPT